MKQTKVYHALSFLSSHELNAFAKFIASPYFNVNTKLLNLGMVFIDVLKEKTSEVSKKELWILMHDGETLIPEFNDRKLNKYHADLLQLLEKFMAQQLFENNNFDQAKYMIQSLNVWQNEKLHHSVFNKGERLIRDQFDRSSKYYNAKYAYYLEKFYLFNNSDLLRKRGKKIKKEINIDLLSDTIDQYYLAEKIKLLVRLNYWKKILDLDQDILYKNLILRAMERKNYQDNPTIAIYRLILLTQLESEEESHFFNLRKEIKKHIDKLPQFEIKEIYSHTLSYSIGKANKGDLSLKSETLDLYKEALYNEALLNSKNELDAVTFNNIAHFAMREGEFDWCENFISTYSSLLNTKDKASSVAFSSARLEFYRSNFEKVIQLLQEVEMESVIFNLSAKLILLFSYYELDEFDAMDALINSFRVYIDREKSVAGRRKTIYKNLLKFMKKLIKVNPRDKSAIKALKEEVEKANDVVSKQWIIQKLEEML